MTEPYEKYDGQYISKRDILVRLWEQQPYSSVQASWGRARAMVTIMGFPASEVQPVRHGHWVTSEATIDSGVTSCSCCRSEYFIGDLQALEGDDDFVMYCPNCGAKMDRGERNEENI